jgi:hypothetical protein
MEHERDVVRRFVGPRLVCMALALLVVAGRVPSVAADEEPTDVATSPWVVDVLLYSWIAGTHGSVDVAGRRVDVDVSPSDVLNLVFDGDALAGAGYLSLAYERFDIFADTMGGYTETHVNEDVPTPLGTLTIRARDRMKFVIGDVGIGYRLGAWPLPRNARPLTLGVYAGARYMYFSNDLNATAAVGGVRRRADVFDSVAWADPLIGVRWSLPIVDWASLDVRADIGGFGASSDLTWGIATTGRLWLPWNPFSSRPYVAAGYRLVAFERSNRDDRTDMQFRGPTLGVGFTY